jgi:hypothetical protein
VTGTGFAFDRANKLIRRDLIGQPLTLRLIMR